MRATRATNRPPARAAAAQLRVLPKVVDPRKGQPVQTPMRRSGRSLTIPEAAVTGSWSQARVWAPRCEWRRCRWSKSRGVRPPGSTRGFACSSRSPRADNRSVRQRATVPLMKRGCAPRRSRPTTLDRPLGWGSGRIGRRQERARRRRRVLISGRHVDVLVDRHDDDGSEQSDDRPRGGATNRLSRRYSHESGERVAHLVRSPGGGHGCRKRPAV
jgi:hypothetical protein